MAEHFNVVEQFGIDVFNEETMKQRLPKNAVPERIHRRGKLV